MKNLEDERPAAVIVCTVITPGASASLAGSPSAIVKLSEETLAGMKRVYPNLKLLDWVKNTLEIETTYFMQAPRATPAQPSPDGLDWSETDRVAQLHDEEVDRHALGDENTPADHWFNS